MASSTSRTKTSDNKSNETSQSVYESNKIKTKTSFENVTEQTVEWSHHHKVSPSPDQSTKPPPQSKQKKSFICAASSPQLNFFPNSTKESFRSSSSQKLYARPFDEFAIVQPNSDPIGGTSIKTDGSGSLWTDKKN